MESSGQTIAIIGGTGKEGKGLAYRWAKAGYTVLIGSRVREKALATVAELRERLGEAVRMEGMTNQEAAEKADIVVLTVPYAAHQETLLAIKDQVQGKI